MSGNVVKGMQVGSLEGVHHDEYTVKNLDFSVNLPDHIKRSCTKKEQQDYLLHVAANELARIIIELDGVFTIDTRYDINTHNTEVGHRMKVLVIKK